MSSVQAVSSPLELRSSAQELHLSARATIAIYALTIFLSAFLLFQIQPLIGKHILPSFGGSAAVWTTSLLFFQSVLLVGYGYAHLVSSRLSPRKQGLVHLALLGAACATLPIGPSPLLDSLAGDNPTWRVLALLLVSVGLPYAIVSSTGPLMQHWFSQTFPGRSPYRLYALSNVGSLLALLSYPILIERYLPLETQSWIWSAGFVAFALLSGWFALRLIRAGRFERANSEAMHEATSALSVSVVATDVVRTSPPERRRIALWIALPAFASIMLLATTNQLTVDVAAVPLLWIVPLSLYLITFIVAFDSARWYRRGVFVPLFVAMTLATPAVYAFRVDLPLLVPLVFYPALLFTIAMSLHGEVARIKPLPQQLTLFYLMVSLGGALGGGFVALVAPQIFTGLWEFQIGLVGSAALFAFVVLRNFDSRQLVGRWLSNARVAGGIGFAVRMSLIAAITMSAGMLLVVIRDEGAGTVFAHRGFYSVLRVKSESLVPGGATVLTLTHGSTMHGLQLLTPGDRGEPTSYYTPDSGVGIAVQHPPARGSANGSLRVGVVGLGVGTIAAYGVAGDTIDFYEIDPAVLAVAEEYFTFLPDARGRDVDIRVWLGDARIEMEEQLAAGAAPRFDVLALDAFSSDAVPIHLLTRESFETYWQLLEPDGILAVHISNRHLDLTPVVRELAAISAEEAVFVRNGANLEAGRFSSEWVLITDNREFLDSDALARVATPWPERSRRPVLWTDDYSNLFALLR